MNTVQRSGAPEATTCFLPVAGCWMLAGTFVTTIGNAMQTLTVGKLLYDHTGSVRAFGSVLVFEQGITLLMQLVAGPWADRGDPRKSCVLVEVLRGLVICATSAMLMLEGHPIAWILVMTLVIRVGQPFYRAATFALAPAVVPAAALARFNGMSNVAIQAGQLLGVAIAGPILLWAGPPTVFLLNGASFLFSAISVAVIVVPAGSIRKSEARANPCQQILGGWREIGALLRREAGLAWHLLLSSADNIAVLLFNLALVPLVGVYFNGSPTWLSFVDGAFALGAIATVIAVDPISERSGSRATMIIGIGGQAACFGLMSAASPAWLVVPLAFGIGAFNTISWTVVTTTLQLRAQGPIKGRLATVRNLITAVISVALVPVITRIQVMSLAGALLASGAVCLAFALIALVLGRSRALGSQLLGPERA